jgi:hypothetical protein
LNAQPVNTLKTREWNSVTIRISVMSIVAFALLLTCRSMAQENSGSVPMSDGTTITDGATNAATPADSAGDVKPEAPSGIPTDVLGIADAMGRPFTVAFVIASVIGVWSVVERLVILRRRRVIPKAFVERFLMPTPRCRAKNNHRMKNVMGRKIWGKKMAGIFLPNIFLPSKVLASETRHGLC